LPVCAVPATMSQHVHWVTWKMIKTCKWRNRPQNYGDRKSRHSFLNYKYPVTKILRKKHFLNCGRLPPWILSEVIMWHKNMSNRQIYVHILNMEKIFQTLPSCHKLKIINIAGLTLNSDLDLTLWLWTSVPKLFFDKSPTGERTKQTVGIIRNEKVLCCCLDERRC